MEVSDELHAPTNVPLTDEFKVLTGCPQNRSGSCEGINLMPLPRLEPLDLGRPTVA